jgi:alkylated DNA nucleotide flippase Atl1
MGVEARLGKQISPAQRHGSPMFLSDIAFKNLALPLWTYEGRIDQDKAGDCRSKLASRNGCCRIADYRFVLCQDMKLRRWIMDEIPVIKTRPKGRSLTQSMLIPSEEMVARALWAAPPGQLSAVGEVRKALASQYGADACCPITVQRHLAQISENGTAPFWRVVDPDRPFARRMKGGPERIRQRLVEEERAVK